MYIENLERDFEKIHLQASKLAPSVPNLDVLIAMTPLQQLKKFKGKTGIEVSTAIASKYSDVLNERTRTKFTTTDLFDLTKELKFKVLDTKKVKNPMIDHQIQCAPSLATKWLQKDLDVAQVFEADCQTDLEGPNLNVIEKKAVAYEDMKNKVSQLQQTSRRKSNTSGLFITQAAYTSNDQDDKQPLALLQEGAEIDLNYESQFDIDQNDDLFQEDGSEATGTKRTHVLSSRVGPNQKRKRIITHNSSRLQQDQESIVERGDSSDSCHEIEGKQRHKVVQDEIESDMENEDVETQAEQIIRTKEGKTNIKLKGGAQGHGQTKKKAKSNIPPPRVYKIVSYGIQNLENILNKRKLIFLFFLLASLPKLPKT